MTNIEISEINKTIKNKLQYMNVCNILFVEYDWNPYRYIKSYFKSNVFYMRTNNQVSVSKSALQLSFKDVSSGLFLFLFKMKIMHSCGYYFSERYTLVYSYSLNSFYVLKKNLTCSVIYEEDNIRWFFDLYKELISVHLLDDIFSDFIKYVSDIKKWVTEDEELYTISSFYKRIPSKYQSEMCHELFSCPDNDYILFQTNLLSFKNFLYN